jgi:hypothetical protein
MSLIFADDKIPSQESPAKYDFEIRNCALSERMHIALESQNAAAAVMQLKKARPPHGFTRGNIFIEKRQFHSIDS